MRFHYLCRDCGHEFESGEIVYLCPKCAHTRKEGEFLRGALEVVIDENPALENPGDLAVSDFLPYDIPCPGAFPAGPTPLVESPRVRERTGRKVSFKMDSQLLSGSFKDRASLLVAAQAIHHGQDRIALASTGNAGAAMSAIGAAYGLEIVLFVPASAPPNKLMQSVLYGAKVVPVEGTYDDAFALSIRYTETRGGVNRNTAYNPMTIEGKKATSIETWLQYGRKAPDVVYVPTGDGCILGGVWKGWKDLFDSGLIEKMPRIVCCQSEVSNAIAKAWRTGEMADVKASTLADSISVSSPANGRMAVRAIRETGGHAVEVSDEAILEAQRELCSTAGLFVEPASAAAWAGLLADLDKIGKDEEVLVLLTGTGFKDMSPFLGKVKLPPSIPNDPKALETL